VAGVCAIGATANAQQNGDLRASLNELLFKAILAGDINAVRTIVEAGADLSRPNMRGKTAMDVAIGGGKFDIAQYLVLARRLEQRRSNLTEFTAKQNEPDLASRKVTVNAAIHQQTPEAAPNVELAKPDRSENQEPADKQVHLSAVNRREPTPAQPSERPYDRILNAAEKLAKAAEALANASAQKPQAGSTAPDQQAGAAEIEQIEESPPLLKNKTVSLFPKPGRKPDYRPTRRLTRSQPITREAPVDGQPNVFSPTVKRVEATAPPQPVIPVQPVAEKEPPGTVQIRPKRRISPELLEKLRRRLRAAEAPSQKGTTERSNKAHIRPASDLAPTPVAPKLPKPVIIDPIPPAKRLQDHDVRAIPQAPKTPAPKTRETVEKAPSGSFVGKLLDGLGGLFGGGSKKAEKKPDADSAANQATKPAPAKTEKKPAPVVAHIIAQEKIEPKVTEYRPDNIANNKPGGAANPFVDPIVGNNPLQPVQTPPQAPRHVATEPPAAPLLATAPKQVQRQPAIPALPPRVSKTVTTKAAPVVADNIPVVRPKTESPSVLGTIKEAIMPKKDVGTQLAKIRGSDKQAKEADAVTRRVARAMPLNRLRKPLTNVLLTLGDSVTTGQPKLPRGIAEPDACVRKRHGSISFCVVPVDWPRIIENAFSVNTMLYQGTRAIARYDGGRANHYHALFDSGDYGQIVSFLKKRYGPPTDIWKRVIAPFDQPRQPNPTYVWRSRDTETDTVTILEIRKFDDARAIFPDTEHGAIRLYRAGGPPVFPVITALDIMKIEWAARSDHIDGGAPTVAKTLRVKP